MGEGWSHFPRNLGWCIFGAILRSGYSLEPSPNFLSLGDKAFNQWHLCPPPPVSTHIHQCTSIGEAWECACEVTVTVSLNHGADTWAGEKGSMKTDEGGKHGLLSRPLVLQSDSCTHTSWLPRVAEVPRVSALGPCWQKCSRKGVHHSFPSQPIKSGQSQQTPAGRVFTICCSLRTIENVKERKNYCSKCGIFWKWS